MADLVWVIGANKGGIAETFRFSAIHDLPNLVGYMEGDYRSESREEPDPVFLENLFESETV